MILNKSPLRSKTLGVAGLVAAAPQLPGVREFITEYPDTFCFLVGSLFGILRTITGQPLGGKRG